MIACNFGKTFHSNKKKLNGKCDKTFLVCCEIISDQIYNSEFHSTVIFNGKLYKLYNELENLQNIRCEKTELFSK